MTDEERRAKAIEWFDKNCHNPRCPICRGQQWGMDGTLVAPFACQLTPAGAELGTDKIMPMLPVICTQCGFIRFHATIPMGLAEPETQPPPSPA